MTDANRACVLGVTDVLEAFDLRGKTWCYVDLEPGHGYSVRAGDAALLHVVVSGEVVLARTGGEPLRLAAGEGVILTAGEAHAVRAGVGAATQALEFLAAEQNADMPASFGMGGGRSYVARVLSARLRITWPEGMSRSAVPALLHMRSGCEGEKGGLSPALLQGSSFGPGSSIVLTRIAGALMADALRRELLVRRTRDMSVRDPMTQARCLVELNPGKVWTVEIMAKAVGMGRSNFSAQFTRTCQQSPMDFVTDIRMQRAAELLRRGDLSITDISEVVGYACESAFNRRFSKRFGISPAQLRSASNRPIPPSTAIEPLGVLLRR